MLSKQDIKELEEIREKPNVLGPLDLTPILAEFILKMNEVFGEEGEFIKAIEKIIEEKYDVKTNQRTTGLVKIKNISPGLDKDTQRSNGIKTNKLGRSTS